MDGPEANLGRAGKSAINYTQENTEWDEVEVARRNLG